MYCKNVRDIEIQKAFYFPSPNSNYKELPFLSYEWSLYARSWIFDGLTIMATVGSYDGVQWLHLSLSRKSRLPTYKEMMMIKRDFIGEDRKALFILPKKENYVNIHNYCLHLWVCERDIIPDFDCGLGTI